MVSAHWESIEVAIGGADKPPMIYDYSGFPPESMEIQHPAAGNPVFAEEIRGLLNEQGITCRVDPQRGYDHGVFVPLRLIDPTASLPTVPVSMLRSLSPNQHLALGAALGSIREAGGLIIGSGMSFHNLRVLIRGSGRDPAAVDAFTDWLHQTLTDPVLSPEERRNRLATWESAPGARYCHPREEHLLPFHVCAAAAGFAPAEIPFDEAVMGARCIAARWE
jgi:aromatic ring-opening dioxygenase catalytic subunit (LigB family)